MAKRKRLGGPLQDYLLTPETRPASAAPIARVASDASVNAAFDEVSRELSAARNEGRLVQRLPLDTIEATWLVRDRAHAGVADDPDFAALLDSLRLYGQRQPIEVVDTGQGRFGLISGWRRLSALRHLHAETGEDRFATVLAFLRRPATAKDAYVAMVEENEIRLGLSYYERARIAAKSVEAGVYPTTKAALQSLYASASRAKRSKIGSFLSLYHALDDLVRFPQTLTERMGLALAKILSADETAGDRLRGQLERLAAPTAEAEQKELMSFIDKETASDMPPEPASSHEDKPASSGSDRKTGSDTEKNEVCPGVYLKHRGDKLQLSGPAVDAEFRVHLENWLKRMVKE